MSISISKITSFALFTSIFSCGNLISLNSANAYSVTFSNGDFQSGTDTLSDGFDGFGNTIGWEGIGSTNIGGTYSTVDYNGTNQGIISTACPNGGTNTLCLNGRNDDPANADQSNFNLRTQDQISASPEIATLQNQLGLSANALSIYRTINGVTYNGVDANPALRRTAKEGSAIFQDITVNNDGGVTDTRITFNWDFLTNDGAGSLGDKDFGFISISGNGFEEVIVLESSTGSIVGPSGNNYGTLTNTYNDGFIQDVTLSPGTYRVGFGVVDVDGVGNSSALLIDEFNAEEVPFEFSPTAGIGLVLGLIGFKKLRRRAKITK